jgi:histidyl-tRNA synthetase
MVKTNNVKGFVDFTGPAAAKRVKVKKILQDEFELFGFGPTETPIIEAEEFVVGKNSVDEAVRDVYRLEDRGKRKLALRYEFTFQLARLARNQKLPFKRYQIGPNFRDEPIRKGRSRQFVQADVDIVGSTLKDDAEVLAVCDSVFKKLEMKVKIYVNNRKLINEILVGENIEEKDRDQVMREIDKLDKLSKKEVADKLKKLGCERLIDIFTSKEKDFEKYKFYSEVRELKTYCKMYGVEVEFRPYLVRGLSYYNGSVFEVCSDELNVSIAGGGSYLINDVQSVGVALGFEPIALLCDIESESVRLQLISVEQDKKTIDLALKLRKKGVSVNVILDKTVKKAMEYANSSGVEYVVVVGAEEVKNKKFKLKEMESGNEKELSEKGLLSELKK